MQATSLRGSTYTHLFITTFDNEVAVLSYAYALIYICKYDNWNLQKLKLKTGRDVEQPMYQEEKNYKEF